MLNEFTTIAENTKYQKNELESAAKLDNKW